MEWLGTLLFEAISAVGVIASSRFVMRRRRKVARPADRSQVALRHTGWAYGSWARQHDWTEDGDAWRGTVRGCPMTIRPHLDDGEDIELTLAIAHDLTRQLAIPSVRGASDIAILTRFFDDEGARLVRLQVQTNAIALWFTPLTQPELVMETAESVVMSLATDRRTTPFR